jgi:hypothetical protein
MRYSIRQLAGNSQAYDWLSWVYCWLGAFLLRVIRPLGCRPNAITLLGPIFALLAVLLLNLMGWPVAFIILAILAYTADEMDGMLARTTGATSLFGGWFDWKCGEAKDWILTAGMSVYWGRLLLSVWDKNSNPFSFDFVSILPFFLLLVVVFFVGKAIFISVRWIPKREDRPHAQTNYRLPPLCLVGDAFKITFVYGAAVFFFPVFAGWMILYAGMYWLSIPVQLVKQKKDMQS